MIETYEEGVSHQGKLLRCQNPQGEVGIALRGPFFHTWSLGEVYEIGSREKFQDLKISG